MNKEQTKIPAAVSVIGYGFIGVGILGVISGLASFFTIPALRSMINTFLSSYHDFGAAFTFLQFSYIISSASIVLSIFILIAGQQFIRLKKWARAGLEVISWCSAFLSVLLALVFVYSCINLKTMLALIDDPAFANLLKQLVITCTAISLFFIIPNILLVVYLRSKSIKNVF